MLKVVEFRDREIDMVMAALLSMSCPLCPLHPRNECNNDPCCRRVAERIAGGDLAEVYGLGDG